MFLNPILHSKDQFRRGMWFPHTQQKLSNLKCSNIFEGPKPSKVKHFRFPLNSSFDSKWIEIFENVQALLKYVPGS